MGFLLYKVLGSLVHEMSIARDVAKKNSFGRLPMRILSTKKIEKQLKLGESGAS